LLPLRHRPAEVTFRHGPVSAGGAGQPAPGGVAFSSHLPPHLPGWGGKGAILMAEAGETLLQILQSITATHTQLVDILSRMEQRQQDHNAALVQMLDRIDARSAAIDARIAADSRALAEILERIVQTTTRTEQMTARILAEVAKGAPQHGRRLMGGPARPTRIPVRNAE